MTGKMSTELELLPPSGSIITGYDCQWYYWSSNQHASFIVWRQKSNQAIGIRATIRFQNGACTYTVIAPGHIKPQPITGTEQGLDAAKIAVNGHLGRIIQEAFHEEELSPIRK